MTRHLSRLMVGLLLSIAGAASGAAPASAGSPEAAVAAAGASDAASLDLFEKKIRPALVEHCYSCHSADAAKNKKLKGGLYLDTRQGVLKGGDTGPALVPGKPAASLLIKAIRYEDSDVEMPPKNKLPDAVIADFVRWVELGAPDPRGEAGGLPVKKLDLEKARQWWSYQPVKKGAPPAVKDEAWPQGEIDRFVLAKLEASGLKPAKDADPRVLLRRLYYDLTGLPPTPEQIDRFVKACEGEQPGHEGTSAQRQKAVEQLVDELLASPRFGERFGRHWLDVVRYGESLTLRGFVLKDAWRYRDYVIEAFNRDLPFDRFMMEQVAGDLMGQEGQGPGAKGQGAESNPKSEIRNPKSSAPSALGPSPSSLRSRMIATTFLMLGNHNLEEQDKKQLDFDIIDEQIDTLGKAFLGQTVGCARCHDHKFDPISQKEYYGLAGIFASVKALNHSNVSNWLEVPLPEEPAREAELKKHEALVADLQGKIKDAKAAHAKAQKNKVDVVLADSNAKKSIVDPKTLPGVVVDDAQAQQVGDWVKSQHTKSYVGDGYLHDENTGKGDKTLTFNPMLPASGRYEVRLAYTSAPARADNVKVTIFSGDGKKETTVNQQLPADIDGHFVSLGQFKFEKDGQSFVIVSNEGTTGHVTADAVQFIPVELLKAKDTANKPDPAVDPVTKDGKAVKGKGKKNEKPDGEAPAGEESTKLAAVVKKMEDELKQLQDKGPKRQTMLGVLEQKPAEVKVMIRGNVHNLGEPAPRGYLSAASVSHPPAMPADLSGRLQLGQWLADRGNPLPARVMANRVWHWTMGQGLVRSVDNFGTTGEVPSHPELLDHLAATFVEDGWSLKKLVRRIVLSRTYQLAAEIGEGQGPGAKGQGADQSEISSLKSENANPKSSASNPKSEIRNPKSIDPENRLLARANRQRLEAECLHDAMLQVSGELVLTDSPGGAGKPTYKGNVGADYGYRHTDPLRAVYAPVFRNALPELFEVFDFADPSLPTGQRKASTVAPQALFMLNHPWVRERARLAATRLLAQANLDDTGRVTLLYRQTLGRLPSAGEMEIASKFLASVGGASDAKKGVDPKKLDAWTQLVQAVFASMDFRYVD